MFAAYRCVASAGNKLFSSFLSVITSNVLLSGQLETHTIDQAKTIFDVNTFVVINIIKAVLPMMKKQRDGRLIIVSNQAGVLGIPFHGIYCASKFAVEGFMESIAPECLAFNIRYVYVSLLPSFLYCVVEKSN